MAMLRKIQRVGKRASKFQFTATYQSVVVECTTKDKWRPQEICVSWTRRGRRFITKLRPWQPSPDNKARGVVIWPEQEEMEITVTLYKGPKDKSYENKEWEFAVIDVDDTGKRKVLAAKPINMVRYVSSLPYDHNLHLMLKPVSRKIKSVILEVSLTSEFLKEGKATDDDMMSIASMMSISNLSTIGFLEDDEDDDYNYMIGGRSISPPEVPDHVLSTDELLKWTQEITKDLPGVKITNMTTSWRSGMGFLAIIHYFRPDLMPDFDMQSPNSIKENNRTAFTVARSLGIACPLTPNMMVTTTIPDKLSVTSFIYQMYQYFTRAKLSAISRAKQEEEDRMNKASGSGSRGISPSSPFDISKFDMFNSNISPVTTPPPRADRVMQYSRYSHGDALGDPHNQAGPGGDANAEISTGGVDLSRSRGQELMPHQQSTPKYDTGRQRGGEVGEATERAVSPGMAADFRLDQVVNEHAHKGNTGVAEVSNFEKDREVEFERANTDTESLNTESSSSLLEDKSAHEMPSEINPVNTSVDHTHSPEGASMYKYTPGHNLKKTTPSDKPGGRKLPSVPSYTSSPKILTKREEIQKQAQELLKRHNLDKLKFPQHSISVDNHNNHDSQTDSIYRKKAKEMLSEAFGSSNSSRSNLFADELNSGTSSTSLGGVAPVSSSEGSTTSLGVTTSGGVTTAAEDDLSSRSAGILPISDRQLKKQSHSDSALSHAHKSRSKKLPPGPGKDAGSESPTRDDSRTVSGGSAVEGVESEQKEVSKSSKRKSTSELEFEMAVDPARKKLMSPRRVSEGNLLAIHKPEKKKDSSLKESREAEPRERRASLGQNGRRKISQETKRSSENTHHLPADSAPLARGSTPNRPSSAVVSDKGKRKPLPVARPISAQPSLALRRKAEQKRLEEEKKRKEKEDQEREKKEREEREERGREAPVRKQGSQTDGEEVIAVAGREGAGEEEEREEKTPERPDLSLMDSVGPPSVNGTPTHSKTLPSPSAWSQHSEDISQDLLVTQSEYVKTELLSLQTRTQDLENRAKNIELDIRVAMSEGNKEEEEELMQEWFGLLNKKNELIKRQIDLNMIEKEEDLEKRQFFLNRELRPLMEIPVEEKTSVQKDREDHLLRELLELIDERDQLERKKMTNMKNSHHERASLASAQAKSADIVHGGGGGGGGRSQAPMVRHGSKDCVIS